MVNPRLVYCSNLKCPEVLVQIETAYISGKVKALIMNNPFADLVIGNVGHIQNENNKDSFQAVETRALKQKREKEEIVQRLTEAKIQSERLHDKELSSKIENSDKNESSDLGQMNTDIDIDLSISKDQLLIEQEKDVTLINVKKYVACQSDIESTFCEKKKRSYFIYENEILYRVFISKFGDRLKQIVVPLKFRDKLLQIAHDVPLGNRKTRQRILQSFFWPGIFIDVAHYCRTCAVCQKTVKKGKVFKAPLISIPPVDEPFARIAMDIVGPLVRSEKGNRFILVVCDYGTKYPEAIPLKTIDAETVANALIDIFSRTGIPREILSDQGSNAQSVTCLATDACLTADPGVASSIPARYHTFVEIDHEIISTVILLLPLIYSRRVVVSYKRKYVHKLLVNRLLKPAQEKVWLSELTIPQ